MQPKFTQGNYGYWSKVIATAMIFVLCTQLSFSQQGRSQQGSRPAPAITAEQRQQKLNMANAMRAATMSNNDKGATVAIPPSTHRTEAICATFNGDLAAGDPTLPGPRMFRDGVPSSCAVPKVYPGTSGAGGNWYDTYTWTNGLGTPQCVNINFTNTSANTFAHFVHAHLGSFDPNNLGTNYLADQGGSAAAGGTAPFSFTVPGSATIVLVVTSVTPGTGGTYTMTVDAPTCVLAPPCSGTPAPGNTLSTVPSACSGSNFTLSLQNNPAVSGLTYQWQTSPNGTTGWVNGTGLSTNSTYTTSQTAATYYRALVNCGANQGISTPLQVLLTPPSGCYCVPVYTNGCTLGDYIARVVLETLDNSSVCSTPPYTYYSAVPAPTLIRGGTYPLTVTVGPDTFGQFVAAWIDANQDGDFADPGEYLGTSTNAGASGTVTLPVTIPVTATVGTTRFRVRGGDDAGPSGGQSCGASNSTFGEAEDYNVNIVACVNATFTAQPANVSVACAGTANISVGVAGSLPSYIWEYRPNSSALWQNVTPAAFPAGVVTSATTNPLVLNSVPSSLNGYQFRVIISNPCTGFDFSSPMTLTVTPLVATVATTPSPATYCNPGSANLRLTNVAVPVKLVDEGFGTVPPAGWVINNLSTPVGLISWFQGNTGVFNAQSGPPDSYAAVNFNSVAGNNTISNWLISPAITVKDGDILSFWTRTVPAVAFPDRLEVRFNTANNGTNVGATNTSVGDFTSNPLTINPGLTLAGYPTSWTNFTVTVTGVGATPVPGRFAFRYFVTGGGPAGANSDYIGIDNVTYTSGATAAGVWSVAGSSPASYANMWSNAAMTIPYAGAPATQVWVNPTVSTNYQVIYSTTTPACTSGPTIIPVTVVQPLGAVTQPANRSACVGGSTTFTVGVAGGPATYQWQLSTDGGATYNNISGATGTSLNVTGVTQTMNNYRYRVVMSAAPCAGTVTSNAAILTVNPLPTVTIAASSLALTPGGSATLTATSTPPAQSATSWTWFYNGSTLVTTPPSNTNTINVGIDQLGDYQARVTDQNGCVNVSNILTVGAAASDKMWIYPNPTDGQFQVRVYFDGPNADIRHIMIYDESGRLVLRKAFDLFTGTQSPYLRMEFDMTRFPAGTYVVKAEERFTGKIKSGLLIIQ